MARQQDLAAAGLTLGAAGPPAGFLDRPALQVAPDLLGAVLVTDLGGARVAVRLTEVEAYEGERDPGSHAFRGRSRRNAVMYGPPGHLYVYRHLGLHACANLVCGPAGTASAVLLRAGEVVEGLGPAWRRRTAAGVCRRDVDLARGPARLTVALGLDPSHNGVAVDGRDGVELRLRAPLPPATARTGPRVGVSGVGGDGDVHPWRFWIDGDPTVSAYRAAVPRTSRAARARASGGHP